MHGNQMEPDIDTFNGIRSLQSHLRLAIGIILGWPVVITILYLCNQIPWPVLLCGYVANIAAGAIPFSKWHAPGSWWFLWRGPLMCFAIEDVVRYAENIQWLQANYGSSIKILGTGIIKFKDAKLAILFKMM